MPSITPIIGAQKTCMNEYFRFLTDSLDFNVFFLTQEISISDSINTNIYSDILE